MRHPSDDVLDGALRMAAGRVRDQEIPRADTDEAWARFASPRADEIVVSVRASRVPGRRRAWVSVVAVGLAAATLVLVWVQSGSAPEKPIGIPSTTVTAATSTTQTPSPTVTAATSTTQISAVDVPPGLVLPTLPANKVIASLSAASDSEWFALSDFGPVGGPQSYPRLWHTVDAGATWVDTNLPDEAAGAASWVHFADPLNGWLMTNQCCLVATHDGGVTWKRIDSVTPRGDEGSAPAISSFGGRVYVLADVPIGGNSRVGVMSSPVDSDAFVWSGTTMGDVRWGLTPNSGQLVVTGQSGWAIAYGATATPPKSSTSGGIEVPEVAVRLIDGEWAAWAPPCAVSLEGERPYQTIHLPRLILGASQSGGTVAVVCSLSTADFSLRVFVSADDGATFHEATRLPDGMTVNDRSWVIAPDDDTILVGVTLDTGELATAKSADRGTSWTVDTSFGGRGKFATATVTPTGRIVVVATIQDSEGTRRTVAQFRDDGGTWHRTGSA